MLETLLPSALAFVFVFWQLSPALLASTGASLDLKKLLVYPIPPARLFEVDVLLRLSTSAEMLLLVSGLAVGLTWNPAIHGKVAALALCCFACFNLLLASGLRHQIERLLARKHLRELVVILLVMVGALPQLLAVVGIPAPLRRLLLVAAEAWWPWSRAARLALGRESLVGWTLLLLWTTMAWGFSRWQFSHSLSFDQAAANSTQRLRSKSAPVSETLFRLPSRLVPDPLASVVEKELRSLARTPRFRLLFVMGFTFGILIFLPILLRGRTSGGQAPEYFLSLVGAYSLLLLSDTLFWNIFGLDRTATQVWFLEPVPLRVVIVGKNLAASIFVVLEITAITLVWLAIRMPTGLSSIADAYAANLVFSLYLAGAGDLASVRYPTPVSPERTMQAGSSVRFRALLFLVFPLAAMPVALAFGARYAFQSEALFYVVLAIAAGVGATFYWVALEDAAERADGRREELLAALSQSPGPIRLG